MAKKSTKSLTLDGPSKKILSVLLTEFRERHFGTEQLRNTYQGLSPAELKSACKLADVDFDLAMSDLDESDLVKTGPMEMYDNPPGSSVTILAFYSKNQYSYLTEEGYKLATRLGTALPKMSVPRVHISGGTFNQSPVGIGAQVSQTVNIQGSSNELFNHLREEIQQQVADEKRRSEILLCVDALEDAPDQPSLLERYNKLVGVIGDHMTVFGPLLIPLLQRLMGN